MPRYNDLYLLCIECDLGCEMTHVKRQQAVLNILQDLRNLDGLKRVFWQKRNYTRAVGKGEK